MKIISEPKKWITQVYCKEKSCRAALEIEEEDVKYGLFGGGYCEDGEAEWYVDCPVCGETIFLKDVPKRIANAARAKAGRN